MQYKVIDETHLSDLERIVNEHIKQGWKPQGGICSYYSKYTGHNNNLRYSQAMIKN